MTLFTSDKQWLDYLTRPTRFLLVEDEESVRTTFKNFASLFNCIVDEATTGKDGIEMFRNNLKATPYQAVFLDIRLPDINGNEVFRNIKIIEPEIPVVVVSGFVNEAILNDIHGSGFAAFVRKPQDFNMNFFVQLFSMLGVKKLDSMPPKT